MKNNRKLKLAIIAGTAFLLGGCKDDSDIASYNISKAADNFEIQRRVVFYNGITNEYMLEIQGLCSLEPLSSKSKSGAVSNERLAVICKTGNKEYKKHFLGLSDNVTYFAEQIEAEHVSAYHYRVTFKPQTILPDVDFRGSVTDGPNTQ